MGRAPCCDKANVKKGPWSPEEDTKLKAYIEQNGTGGNWIALPQKIGLKRCGKSCRLRWLNYLRPNIKHGGFSEEEDNIICGLYLSIGSRWSIIAGQLPGRTDNDIKNYWNTRLKKKLLGKQRKELQEARLKQEMAKREHHQHNNIFFSSSSPSARISTDESGITMTNNNYLHQQQQQTLYFPQLQPHNGFMNPLEVPNFYSSYQTNDIQEPMLKNLVKIEDGQPSDYDQMPFDYSFAFPDHQFVGFGTAMNNNDNEGDNSNNFVMRSSTNSPLPDYCGNNHNKGYNINHQEMIIQGYNEEFQVEPAIEMGFDNFMPNLDGPVDADELYGRSNSADQSTISWDDISSLVYHPSQNL